MLVIGVVGGICSGKSTVARLFGQLGAVVLDADAAAGDVLAGKEVRGAIRERWGEGVFDDDGTLNRAAVSRTVFGDDPQSAVERAFLEGLVHPRVRESFDSAIAECRQRGVPAVVLDVPLLVEAGWHTACDVIVYISSAPADRRRRAAERGWPPGELNRREATQLAVERKKSCTHAEIDNARPLREVATQVQQLWQQWGLPS